VERNRRTNRVIIEEVAIDSKTVDHVKTVGQDRRDVITHVDQDQIIGGQNPRHLEKKAR
jgi:hypothetical protein